MADPHKDNVVLYLPMEGSRHGDTVFIDKTGKTITRNGGVSLSTAIAPPFGTTSAYFDGDADYLQLDNSPSLEIGAGDFTIEFLLYVVSWGSDAGALKHIVGTYSYGSVEGGTANDGWSLGYQYNTGLMAFGWGLGDTWTGAISSSGAVVLNTWAQFAIARKGSAWYLFKNGVIIATATNATDFSRANKTKFNIGCRNSNGTYAVPGLNIHGYLKALRITKNVARYTGNFYVDQKPFAWDEPEQSRIML